MSRYAHEQHSTPSQASVFIDYSRAQAAQVYLVEQWHNHSGEPVERRNEIFRKFVALGMRGRWEYHRRAEQGTFHSDEEKAILSCRTHVEYSVAFWATESGYRILFNIGKLKLSSLELEWCTRGEDDEKFVSRDIDSLPERVYSMTAFDDPADVEEAREEHDQSLWVSGVYWVADADNSLKILWVDEFGNTIREKVCQPSELEPDAKLFDAYQPFETTWWTEATSVGKYAREGWWHCEAHSQNGLPT